MMMMMMMMMMAVAAVVVVVLTPHTLAHFLDELTNTFWA